MSEVGTRQRHDDRLIWLVLAGSGIIAVLTLVAIHFNPPTPLNLPPGAGRTLPRMRTPGPIASTGDLLRSMGIGSLTWYASILSAPVFVWLGRRFPIDRDHWTAGVSANLLLILALLLATAALQYRLTFSGVEGPPVAQYLRIALLTGSLPFLTVAAAAHALEARLRAGRVRAQLVEARLDTLNSRLQPHFLFNTLQAITTLISRDPEGAERMLANLADLLREVLRHSESREIALDEELRLLEAYLAISQRRFGDRLIVTIGAPLELGSARVPPFVLQPLVENALQHGVESRSGPATVRIDITRSDQQLQLTVADDGPGSDSARLPRGVGLSNTEARLAELYPGRYRMDVSTEPGRGFEVRVTLPYRTAQ